MSVHPLVSLLVLSGQLRSCRMPSDLQVIVSMPVCLPLRVSLFVNAGHIWQCVSLCLSVHQPVCLPVCCCTCMLILFCYLVKSFQIVESPMSHSLQSSSSIVSVLTQHRADVMQQVWWAEYHSLQTPICYRRYACRAHMANDVSAILTGVGCHRLGG